MAKPTQPFAFASRCHVGNHRSRNEDFALARWLDATPEPALLAVVCDGVGGYPCGDVASKLAAETFADFLQARLARDPSAASDDSAILRALADAAQQAHDSILDQMDEDRRCLGMATTLTAALLLGDRAFTAQVGDSRAYRLRAGRLEQITDDQSEVGELLRAGIIDRDAARHHPHRNVINQVLGSTPLDLKPDCRQERLQPGDVLLLCTDGLPDSLRDESIQRILLKHLPASPEAASDALLEAALEEGGHDNVTFIIVQPSRSSF